MMKKQKSQFSLNNSSCEHPKDKLIKNKLGMIGCLKCDTWITSYHRRHY